MAYSSVSGHLPFESASKTGHVALIQDDLITALLKRFQTCQQAADAAPAAPVSWQTPNLANPLTDVVSCDGSYSVIQVPESAMKVAYIRVGLHHSIPADLMTGRLLHPAQFAQDIRDNSDSIQTVLPLGGLSLTETDFNRLIRKTIFETYAHKHELLNTVQWLCSRGWNGVLKHTRSFRCPICGKSVDYPLAELHDVCPHCGDPLFITDLLGFQSELEDTSAPETLATCFMMVTEYLLLFTAIRFAWENYTPYTLDQTLFLKDGPLTISSYYSHLVPLMRDFLWHASKSGRPIYLCGAEKSGRFVTHLAKLLCALPPADTMRCFIPTNRYVQTIIDGRSLDASHQYSERHILGHKVFTVLPGDHAFVLSVPAYLPHFSFDMPTAIDLIGVDRILATVPTILSYRYDNALLPISLVNDYVSISNHPSGRMLELYSAKATKEGDAAS